MSNDPATSTAAAASLLQQGSLAGQDGGCCCVTGCADEQKRWRTAMVLVQGVAMYSCRGCIRHHIQMQLMMLFALGIHVVRRKSGADTNSCPKDV
jgi:hypothetical protein